MSRVPYLAGRLRLPALQALHPRSSVGAKLFLIIFCSILLCVLAGGQLSYRISKQIIVENVSDASQQTIRQTSGKLNLLLGSLQGITDQFATDQVLQDQMNTLLTPKLSSYAVFQIYSKLTERLLAYGASNPMITDSYLIPVNDTAKASISATSASVIGTSSILWEDVAAEPWFQSVLDAKDKPVWIPVTPVRPESASNSSQAGPTIGVARLLSSQAAQTGVFILLLQIRLDAVADEFADVDLGQGSALAIVDGSGRYVYNADAGRIGQAADFALDGGDRGSSRFDSADGKQLLAYYGTMDLNGWRLVGTVPAANLTKDAGRISTATWVVAAVAALLALAIGLFVVRIVAMPLRRLQLLMRQGKQGDLTVRSPIRSRDEIGQLADSFNQMMAQITELVERMRASARDVLQTAGELAGTSKHTAEAAREIAQATGEIARSAESLAAEAEKGGDWVGIIDKQRESVAEAGARMGVSAKEVRAAGEAGTAYMGALLEQTGRAEEMTREMAGKMERLRNSTGTIRQVLDLLHQLASTTNILSLNASIEAARAGAAGKSFMVVAEEIKRLADQSRGSIQEITRITDSIQADIEGTVQAVSDAHPVFRDQIGSVRESGRIFDSVQRQMERFAESLASVTDSIGQLDRSQEQLSETVRLVGAVSEQTLAASQEVSSVGSGQLEVSERLVRLSGRLEEVSSQLEASLGRFRV